MYVSLDVKFNNLNRGFLIRGILVTADSHVNAIGCGIAKILTEPRWLVELTAGALRTTPLPVPQGIKRVEDTRLVRRRSAVAEVVLAHKRWQSCVWEGVGGVSAGTDVTVTVVLVQSGGEGPNVSPRSPVSETNTVHIVLIDGDAGVVLVCEKSIW